jgi:hypothetical protein
MVVLQATTTAQMEANAAGWFRCFSNRRSHRGRGEGAMLVMEADSTVVAYGGEGRCWVGASGGGEVTKGARVGRRLKAQVWFW